MRGPTLENHLDVLTCFIDRLKIGENLIPELASFCRNFELWAVITRKFAMSLKFCFRFLQANRPLCIDWAISRKDWQYFQYLRHYNLRKDNESSGSDRTFIIIISPFEWLFPKRIFFTYHFPMQLSIITKKWSTSQVTVVFLEST